MVHLERGELPDGFTNRDIYRHEWPGLADRRRIDAGLARLTALGHLAMVNKPTGPKGGRPTVGYLIKAKAA
jgi:hypothetical protein